MRVFTMLKCEPPVNFLYNYVIIVNYGLIFAWYLSITHKIHAL